MKEIFYFLLGASVGAVIALLFAPQSGSETRADIQAAVEENWKKIRSELQAGMEKTQARLDQLQSDLKQVMQKEEQAETESATALRA
jgi:gas vesicle protein